jgi:hypothetical protein
MLQQMTRTDFARWQAWYRISLPGEARIEHYLSQLCALTASAHFKGSFKPKDFAPDLRSPEQRIELERVTMKAQADFDAMKARAIKGIG